MLDYFFKTQFKFQRHFMRLRYLTEEERMKWTKEFILCITKEVYEILNLYPWKLHRKINVDYNKENFIEELIDVQKFLINIAIVNNVSVEEYFKKFVEKSAVVDQRYRQEFQLQNLKSAKNIAVFDLDGVLCDYDNFFTKEFNRKYKTNYINIEIIKQKAYKQYIEFKDIYRATGYKRRIPVIRRVKNIVRYLKIKHFKIIIISARPYKKYSRIFSDTLHWLKINNIKFDALYFDEEKEVKIIKELKNISFVVEDDLKHANLISLTNKRCYLLNKYYNQGFTQQNVIRTTSDELMKHIQGEVKKNDSRRNKRPNTPKTSQIQRLAE